MAAPVSSTYMYSDEEIAAMPTAQQQAALARLSPYRQGRVQDAARRMRMESNRTFMRQSVEQISLCPPAGGGQTATYAVGSTLNFDFPVIGGAYAKGILITYSLAITPASGSSATYNVNAGAPWNIFTAVRVVLNDNQIDTHPYVFKLLDITDGWLRGQRNQVLAGNNDSTIATNIVGSTPLVPGSAGTWAGKIWVPFNVLGEDTVPGLLPIMGVGNKPRIELQCASSLVGYDPWLYPISANAGTGHSASLGAATIQCDVVYLDGKNMGSPTGLVLDLANEPTIQYRMDVPLNPLTAGSLNRQQIRTYLEHYYVFSIVMDGVQSTTFSTLTNLQQFGLATDESLNNYFKKYNIGNNISVYDFYDREIRRRFGQDFDPGVIPWVVAPATNIIDPSNHNGTSTLNMKAGGFPAASHAYYVGSVSATNFQPRVETILISRNDAGLRIS